MPILLSLITIVIQAVAWFGLMMVTGYWFVPGLFVLLTATLLLGAAWLVFSGSLMERFPRSAPFMAASVTGWMLAFGVTFWLSGDVMMTLYGMFCAVAGAWSLAGELRNNA